MMPMAYFASAVLPWPLEYAIYKFEVAIIARLLPLVEIDFQGFMINGILHDKPLHVLP